MFHFSTLEYQPFNSEITFNSEEINSKTILDQKLRDLILTTLICTRSIYLILREIAMLGVVDHDYEIINPIVSMDKKLQNPITLSLSNSTFTSVIHEFHVVLEARQMAWGGQPVVLGTDLQTISPKPPYIHNRESRILRGYGLLGVSGLI